MTTNKPEVFEVYRTKLSTLENVVPLDEYDALQAEYAKLRKDFAGLVEALELISDTDPNEGTAWFHEIAYKALAAYRKGGEA